jgi:hypothetical protein
MNSNLNKGREFLIEYIKILCDLKYQKKSTNSFIVLHVSRV